MTKVRHSLKTSALILALMLAPTASFFNCGQCHDVPPHFSITGLKIGNCLDEGYSNRRAIEPGESVQYSGLSFFISAYFEASYHAGISRTGGYSLYALSCEEPGSEGSVVGVDTLYMIGLDAYNQTHAANDTLNDIVLLTDYGNKMPLDDYVDGNRTAIRKQYFEVWFTEWPSHGDKRFKLVYILEDGQVFQDTTDLVRFIP